MNPNDEISASPVNTGAETSQLLPDVIEVPKEKGIVSGGLEQCPLTEALEVIATIRGQSGMVLLQSYTRRIESDLNQAEQKINELTKELKETTKLYYEEKEKVSNLKVRLQSTKEIRHLRNILITVGGLFSGAAIRFLPSIWGIVILIIGVVLLGAGWLRKGEEK